MGEDYEIIRGCCKKNERIVVSKQSFAIQISARNRIKPNYYTKLNKRKNS